MPDSHHAAVRSEFERAASAFARRTEGRFQDLDVVRFARVRTGAVVMEVGAGTGNFLSLFSKVAARLIAVDLTHGMLLRARSRYEGLELVIADGARLPFEAHSIDLAASAQMMHHIWHPLDIIREMRRVVKTDGRLIIVDQVAPENYEEAAVMNELEVTRDPSHAASRPPSAFRILVRVAGLEILDEKIVSIRQRLSDWMWPEEFPAERIAAVRRFIERHGDRTGMKFVRDGDDWVFVRRRIALLAEPAHRPSD